MDPGHECCSSSIKKDDNLQFKIIQSNRGKQNLLRNGFTYRLDHTGKDRISWRCTNRKCAAQVKTDTDIKTIIYENRKDHCHKEDAYKLERQYLRAVCKEKALKDIDKKPTDIIREETHRYGYNVFPSSKDTKFLESVMYRARKKMISRNRKKKVCSLLSKQGKTIKSNEHSFTTITCSSNNHDDNKLNSIKQSPLKSEHFHQSPTQDDSVVSELFQQPFDNHFDIFNTSGFDHPGTSFSSSQHISDTLAQLPNTPQHVPTLNMQHTPQHDPSNYSFTPLALSQQDLPLSSLPTPSLPLGASIMHGLTDKPPDILLAETEEILQVKKVETTINKGLVDISDIDNLEKKMKDKAHYIPFRRAIQINGPSLKDSVVLDAGAGYGLLSHFAMQVGARIVFAVEASNLAIALKKNVDDSNANFIIHVVKTHPKDLTEGDLQGFKIDAIISDWMGQNLLCRSLISGIIHIRDKFLKPQGYMYPQSASLFLAPFENDMLEKFDSNIQSSDLYGLSFKNFHSFKKDCFINEVQTHNLEMESIVADSAKLLEIDLFTVTINQCKCIQSKFELTIQQTSSIKGFATWWSVVFPGSVCLDTSPFARETSHGQTIFFLKSSLNVSQNDKIHGKFSMYTSISDSKLWYVQVTYQVNNEKKQNQSWRCKAS